MASQLILPYQGKIAPLLASKEETSEWQQRIKSESLPSVVLSSREAGDLDMLAIGGFSPLQGFMGHDDWQGVCKDMKTASGYFWPIPITLAASEQQASSIKEGGYCQLLDQQQNLLGVMQVNDKYKADKLFEAKNVFGTDDKQHPGVANLYKHADLYLGGEVKVFCQSNLKQEFPKVYLTPTEAREKFTAKGWSKVVAFQTRNPMHRAHEYLVKIALEICDGAFIHSLLGNLKPGDLPADIRIRSIEALVDNYFPADKVINAGYPLDMRYAGPREALLHALFRQNYGCSHIIIGRDHAGVGDYYDKFAAHRIFDEIEADALLIKPLKLDWTFWCVKCEAITSTRTCPHNDKDRLLISGTELRRLFSQGEEIPPEFSRPEVLEILREYYANQ